MALGKRLINVGGVACTTETTDIFGDSSGKLLYSFDTDASDTSGVYNGTPTDVDFGVTGKINTGVRFPQTTSQRIQFTNPISNASNADFNVSFFIKFRSITGGSNGSFAYAIVSNPASQYGTFQIFTYYHASGLVFMLQRTVGTTLYYSTTYNTDIPVSVTANTYAHISINYTASSYQIEIFKDGVSAGTSTLDATLSVTAVSTSSIGYNPGSAANAFNGSLDQFRIFNRKLTGSEITTLVGETACVHTATTDNNDFPVTNAAYYKLDNSADDSKGTNDGTETDIEYRFGKYNQAAVFNGSSSRINTGYQIPSGLTGFSVSAWVKAASVKTQFIVGDLGTGGASADGMFQINISSSNVLRAAVGGTASQTIATLSSYIDTWTHIVVTTDSSGNIIGYVNGSQVGTASGNSLAANTKDFMIGMFGDLNHSSTFNGSIDQVRIFQSELTQANVTSLYNEKPETISNNFVTSTYFGNGATQYISNVGMDLETDGGLVWVKNRNATGNHSLIDSVRGVSKPINSNATNQEQDYPNFTLTSFEKNGFFVTDDSNGLYGFNGAPGGTYGGTTGGYVAWVWKGGGAAVSNGNGSITSSVSANTAAGFSIVSWTGNGTGATIGHGLSAKPEVILIKARTRTNNWGVYAEGITANKFLVLNDNVSASTSSTAFNDTEPTSSIFTVGSSLSFNNSGTMIAYCFHSVSGYSKISTYTGDGTSSGTTISVGFKPSFLIVKNADTTATNWFLFDSRRDPSNPLDSYLQPNTNAAEANFNSVNFNSTGFELLSNLAYLNQSGDTYLYMAFK